MAKTALQNLNKNKLITKMLLCLVGFVFIVLFSVRLVTANNHNNTDLIYNTMSAAAEEMSEIKSVAGGTVTEAYYQNHGTYLYGEAKYAHEMLTNSYRSVMTQNLIGLMFALGLVIVGIAISPKMNSPQSK
ncbi:hypothetical protein FWD20_01505 [Candidatus Saccharibacteria bacterium]|nr:hypothetical protein [Candidatus Saccharibacteria bacterium]